MRLIIDIPDEYFEQIKNNTEGSTAESEAVTAIRNGVPYKEIPQGDSISREVLKEALKENACEATYYPTERILALIDNAPAVDTFTLEDIQEVQENALILGAKLAQRTQGEWIEHSDGYISFCTCNKCSRFGYKDDNFCPNCGADMRKGGSV